MSNNKTILVVGGAGYIGSQTVKHLSENGYQVIVADNLVYGHKEALDTKIPFYKADLEDINTLRPIFKQHQIDGVLHFAAYTYVGESVQNPQKYYKNNLKGTINLLEVMLENNVKKIVFSSTCATYGNPQYMPMDEKHPQAPINPYGKSKYMVEQIFKDYAYAYGLKYIALRYFNAAGADESAQMGESHNPETHLIPLVLRAIKGELKNITVFGTDYDTPDGTCIRDYVHVEDLAQAHRIALEKLDTFCGFINLGTGNGTSVKEVIAAAEKVTGKKCPVVYGARRDGDPARLYADNKFAKNILGWQVKYPDIESIVRTAWNWEKNKKF